MIVGGGTTGWLAAAILNHRLQWGLGAPADVRIRLIEDPNIPTLGVGEATIPAITHTLEMLEISEAEFIARTHATFKIGVRFDNWHKVGGGKPHSYFHPFTGGVQVAGRNPVASLLAYGLPDDVAIDPQVGNIVGHGVAAALQMKSPRRHGDPPYQGVFGYAYHLDAGEFAAFLREIAVARGVIHVQDRVVDVERDARGHIAALQLADGGRTPVELVIDCSGFAGLLINGAMEEPFESFSDYLPNDRAVAIQVASPPNGEIYPATISTAMHSGWSWRIPLQNRVGTGYVFSSQFTDADAAVEALLAQQSTPTVSAEPRLLKMRVGRSRRSFVGNCVALGLASGFVEPLESTAIQFVDFACRRLLQCMPSTDFEPGPAAKFNRQMNEMYDEIRDFLGLHFTLGDRDDTPYWRAIQHEAKRSDRLEECLAIWRRSLPDVYDPRPGQLFTFWSVQCVLAGKGFLSAPTTGTELLPRPLWEDFIRRFAAVRAPLLAVLPDHAESLRALVSMAVHGESAGKSNSTGGVPRLGLSLGPSIPVMTPDKGGAALLSA